MGTQRFDAIAVLRRAAVHIPNELYIEVDGAIDRLECVLKEAARRADGVGNLRALRKAISSARGAA